MCHKPHIPPLQALKSLCDTFLEKASRENIRVRAQRLINKIQTLSHLKGGEITTVEPHVFFSSTGSKATHVCFTEPPAREGNEPKLRTFVHLPPPRLETRRGTASATGRGCAAADHEAEGKLAACHVCALLPRPGTRQRAGPGAGRKARPGAASPPTAASTSPAGTSQRKGGAGVDAAAESTPRRRPQPATEQRLRPRPRRRRPPGV